MKIKVSTVNGPIDRAWVTSQINAYDAVCGELAKFKRPKQSNAWKQKETIERSFLEKEKEISAIQNTMSTTEEQKIRTIFQTARLPVKVRE